MCLCLSLHIHTAWCSQGLLLRGNFGIVELVLGSLQLPPHHLQGKPDTHVALKIVYGGRLGGILSVSNKVPFFRWGFSLTLKPLRCPGLSTEQNWGDVTAHTSGLHLGWGPTYNGPHSVDWKRGAVVLQSGPHFPFHLPALLLAARTLPVHHLVYSLYLGSNISSFGLPLSSLLLPRKKCFLLCFNKMFLEYTWAGLSAELLLHNLSGLFGGEVGVSYHGCITNIPSLVVWSLYRVDRSHGMGA